MKNKVYIGNLSYDLNESDLQTAFQEQIGDSGTIEDITIIMDKATGRSKGFGFITFDSDNSAEAALGLNGAQLGGRTLKVSIARERTEGGGDRGGRGGRDDRGGRSGGGGRAGGGRDSGDRGGRDRY